VLGWTDLLGCVEADGADVLLRRTEDAEHGDADGSRQPAAEVKTLRRQDVPVACP
jgi:hypothetical protein